MYKINDKVETPLGVGVIYSSRHHNPIYGVIFNDDTRKVIEFDEAEITPYITAHEKLVALGCKLHEEEDGDVKVYQCPMDDTERSWSRIIIYGDYIDVFGLTKPLARILTQYLEEME